MDSDSSVHRDSEKKIDFTVHMKVCKTWDRTDATCV
jgi:hypothetical protein